MTDNDFNPVVEIQAEVQANPTLQIQGEVDMGSLASERNAEAWAVGQRGGVDVSSTDQTYHNNAKYWAEQAEQTVVGSIIDDTSTALNKVWSAHKVSEEIAETNGEVTNLKSAFALETETVPDTVQTIAFDSSGNVQSITHTRDNVAVRTDVFTFGANTITEVRTLSTGESLTIVTNTDTLVTTITYADAA